MNILVDPNPLFDPKNSQFWLFLSENEIFGVSGKNELRVSMGPKCWFFVYFFFGAPPKKPTLWPRGDKKSKQKPCCVFTNFSKFFYLYEENFGRHNKQNGISGIVMGEHTRTILSFSETQPPRGLRNNFEHYNFF